MDTAATSTLTTQSAADLVAILDSLSAPVPAAKPAAAKVHKFELAGLGQAPYRFTGQWKSLFIVPGESARPGSSCDYCATSIANVYDFTAADGKKFHVGSDCVMKAGDAGMKKVVAAAVKANNAALRAERSAKVKVNVVEALKDESTVAALSALPHPRGFMNRETGAALTLLDWAQWMLANAGAKGRSEVAKVINGLAPVEE
jgi:hypothetical protein